MPKSNPRTCAKADGNVRLVIEGLRNMYAIESTGKIAQPVIMEWYERDCLGRSEHINPHTKRLHINYTVNNRHSLEAICVLDRMGPHSGRKYETPKRWYDTKQSTRLYLALVALQHNNTPHQQLSFYIGKQLISRSKEKREPLAKILNKRIQRELKSVLGEVEFGFWFHIEGKRKDKDALHAHGFIYVEKEEWFKRNSSKRRKLVAALKKATAEDGAMSPANWIDLNKKPINTFWISYCRKGRRDQSWIFSNNTTPDETIGLQLSSMSHTLSRRTKIFYERLRPLITAIVKDRLEDFDESDWQLLNKGY